MIWTVADVGVRVYDQTISIVNTIDDYWCAFFGTSVAAKKRRR